MISNFNELYLENISAVFGDMLNYAVNVCKEDGDKFLRKFIESGIAKEFEIGNPKYIVGKSGIEIAMEILRLTDYQKNFLDNTTKEYWAASVLAKFKYNTEMSFEEILKGLPFSKILELYHPLHEADITKFFEVACQFSASTIL
ncbi:MAG: hypothetical protein LBH25_07375 [Fibromonadaceae bacterium]|jgi:hypothetical protein|nr:hypothetical protein [Fibromonadaceae bacterium]